MHLPLSPRLLGVLLAGLCPLVRAATVSIPASADAVIYSPKPGDTFDYANGAGDYLHAGVNGFNGGNRILRSPLRFDLAGQIPAGATVTQVVVRVTSYKHSGTLRLHRISQAWTEGTANGDQGEGLGVAAGNGDVTWTSASHGTTVWGTAGGSFAATPSAIATLAGAGPLLFSSMALVADVQAMVQSPAGNQGWMLVNTDESTGGNSIQLASRSHPTAADRPVLEVGFSAQPYPVLYYDFSEGAGTVITNKGTLAVNGTLLGTGGDERWVTGPRGGALEFDGQNAPDGDYIATGLSAPQLGFSSSNYTACAWINFTKPTGDSMVFSQTNAASNVLHDGVRASRIHLGHWANDITGSLPLSTGVWYHVVWEYRQGFQRIFVNGNLDVGPLARGLLPNVSAVTIGRTGYVNGSFQGRLDEVSVFNRDLNLAHIRYLAAGGDPRTLPADEVTGNPTFHTAPFGPGGTWNLYQFRGIAADRPRTWVDAENQALAMTDPSGLTSVPGHLADVTARQENFFLERISNFSLFWIGLTDNEAYGATEAGTNKNGPWKWTSGVAYSYQNWAAAEPNNSTAAGEDAVQIAAGTGLWNDHLNGIAPQTTNAPVIAYMVEWQVASPTPVPGAQVMPPIFPSPLAGRGPANAAFGVRAVSNNGTFDNIARAVTALQNGLGTIVEGRAVTINAFDPELPSGLVNLPGDEPFVGNTPVDDNYILHVYKGRLSITNTAAHTFVLRTDDGGGLRIPGQTWTTVYGNGVIDIRSPDTLYRERGTGDLRGVITLPAGLHDIEVLVYEQTGGAMHELYAAEGDFDLDLDTPAWRLVGHRSRGPIAIPGIKLVNGTNWLVRTSAPGGNAAITNLNNLANAEVELANDPNILREDWEQIDFMDPNQPGTRGTYRLDYPFPGDTPANDEDFALEATGTLEIPATGAYQFGFRGDDGASLQIVGQTWSNLTFSAGAPSVIAGDTIKHDANAGDSHTRASITLAAGTYPVRVLYWERGGGADFEVYGDTFLNVFPNLLTAGGGRMIPDPAGLPLAVVEPIQVVAPAYSAQNGTVSLSWNSMANASYRVEWSVDYLTWTPLQSGVASQGALTTLVVNDTFGSPFVVFRILEE